LEIIRVVDREIRERRSGKFLLASYSTMKNLSGMLREKGYLPKKSFGKRQDWWMGKRKRKREEDRKTTLSSSH